MAHCVISGHSAFSALKRGKHGKIRISAKITKGLLSRFPPAILLVVWKGYGWAWLSGAGIVPPPDPAKHRPCTASENFPRLYHLGIIRDRYLRHSRQPTSPQQRGLLHLTPCHRGDTLDPVPGDRDGCRASLPCYR